MQSSYLRAAPLTPDGLFDAMVILVIFSCCKANQLTATPLLPQPSTDLRIHSLRCLASLVSKGFASLTPPPIGSKVLCLEVSEKVMRSSTVSQILIVKQVAESHDQYYRIGFGDIGFGLVEQDELSSSNTRYGTRSPTPLSPSRPGYFEDEVWQDIYLV
jgi:hypothetical protein